MFLYIDPGTGSMLFTILIGIATAAFFSIKKIVMRIGFIVNGGRKKREKDDNTVHPCVIFSDSKRYWNVFCPVCNELEKRCIKTEYWTMSADDPALGEKYKYINCVYIGNGNSAFAKLNMMNANICLSTTPGLDVYQWKRSKRVKHYVHITHDVCSVTAYRMFGIDFYDAVLLPNHFIESELRELERKRGLAPKEVTVVGSTYMDGLRIQYEKYRKNNNLRDDGISILVAPSWGESSLLNRYGEVFIDALIETGYTVIIRPHPQSFISDFHLIEALKKKYSSNKKIIWNEDNDNFEIMSKSSILISDFSGIIFDFAFTFGRPVIYADTKLDLSPYDDCWLDAEPWRLSILPAIGRQLQEDSFDKMKQIIDEMINDKQSEFFREELCEKVWEYQGKAAILAVDFIEMKMKEQKTTCLE